MESPSFLAKRMSNLKSNVPGKNLIVLKENSPGILSLSRKLVQAEKIDDKELKLDEQNTKN